MKTPILKKEIIKIFQKYGLSKDHALISANALINAELVGAYGHGLSRLKMYCDRISKKVINPKPKIKIKKISQSISHIDANNSIGFVAADLGIKTAIKHAQKTGIGMVAVKNSGHYGLSGYYAEQAVKKNLIAMIYTNAPPAVAPHGALKSLFGTNPVCFGTPTGSKVPFILDTSISMINRGKIRVAARNNQTIPEGVALDKSGNPTRLMLLFYRYCFVIKAYYINTLYYVAIKGNTWYMYIYTSNFLRGFFLYFSRVGSICGRLRDFFARRVWHRA